MYGGKLQKIKFRYSGSDVDAILDRLPTAEIISEKDGIYILEAEVFGKGIDMWLRSQGDWVKKIEEGTEETVMKQLENHETKSSEQEPSNLAKT